MSAAGPGGDGGADLTAEDSYRAGIRAALPLALPTVLIGASFGIAATTADWGLIAPVVMSAIVYSGAAQFAIVSVLGAGGSVIAAIAAATLIATRFLAMGAAIGPSMRGGRLRRAFEGQAVVDASIVLARVGEARYGPRRLLGSTLPQYVGWSAGTLLGVVAGDRIGDPEALGLDVVFPAFFVSLVVNELATPAARVTGAVAVLLALVLIPTAPAGIPVIASCLAVLAGLAVERRYA